MNQIYKLEQESPNQLIRTMAGRVSQRRLERGWSRKTLSERSGVPESTIAKFEQHHTLSLRQFIALVIALDDTENLKSVLAKPVFHTMEELENINRNKNRQRGSRQ